MAAAGGRILETAARGVSWVVDVSGRIMRSTVSVTRFHRRDQFWSISPLSGWLRRETELGCRPSFEWRPFIVVKQRWFRLGHRLIMACCGIGSKSSDPGDSCGDKKVKGSILCFHCKFLLCLFSPVESIQMLPSRTCHLFSYAHVLA